MKIMKWLLLSPLALLGLLVIVYIGFEINKAYWDYQVTKLCKEDGGVTVYEKIELSQEEYEVYGGANGVIPIPNEESPNANKYPYVWKSSYKLLRKDFPKVKKSEYFTYEKSNKKIIAHTVDYSREGGDFPDFISVSSSFNCDDVDQITLGVEKKIFIFKGDK